MPETGGPVPEFLDAVQARALDRAAALLAPGVQLSIPPLHYARSGPQEVYRDLAGLLNAFTELRYDVRGRYLTPASVTDEAVFAGRQTCASLGAFPAGDVFRVPARVITEHDGVRLTRLTIWPDLAALHAAVADADRVIDLTAAERAGGMIAALRATIPPKHPRVVLGEPREVRPTPPVAGRPPSVRPVTGPACEVPRPPVPKKVRRRRAALAGGSMLVAAGALASWVTVGALTLPHPPAKASGASAAGAEPDGANSADGARGGPGAGGGSRDGGADGDGATGDASAAGETQLAPARQLAAGRNTVIIGSDLLFATDSARLTPKARGILRDLITQAKRSSRRGTVTVSGYTDDVGTARYNLSLSRRRAASVAAVLRAGLGAHELTVVSRGYGETHPVRPNATPEGKQANRRVTAAFPPPAG